MEGKSGQELAAMLDADDRFHTSKYARTMLENTEFNPATPEEITVARVTVGELGFSKYATTDQIYQQAHNLGLVLCPAEVGPKLRMQDVDQKMHDWYAIGMEQIAGSDGFPYVFYLRRDESGLWLDGSWTDPDNSFVFRVPQVNPEKPL